MLVYAIGQPFPFPHRQPGTEGAIAQLTDSFLTIVCYLQGPTPAEIAQWRAGVLRYGLFEAAPGLPVILTDAGANWLFEVTLNLRRPGAPVEEEAVRLWPSLPGRQLTYALVDATTNVLHGLRIIQADPRFVVAVRACAQRQLALFATNDAVAAALDRAAQLPLVAMRAKTTFYLPGR